MKYHINRLKLVLSTGLLLLIYQSIEIAQAIDIIDPTRAMASQCAQCHGMEGNNAEGFDDLNGEPFDEIYDVLMDMLSSSDNELMHHQAKGYTQDQIIALANYFSEQAKTSSNNSEGISSEPIKIIEKEVDEVDEIDEVDDEESD